MYWINVTKDRDNLWAVVNMVVNPQSPNTWGIPWRAKELVNQSVSVFLAPLISNFTAPNSNFNRVLTAQSVTFWQDMGSTQGLTVHTISNSPNNIWQSTQCLTVHTISDSPHNILQSTQYLTVHTTKHPHTALIKGIFRFLGWPGCVFTSEFCLQDFNNILFSKTHNWINIFRN